MEKKDALFTECDNCGSTTRLLDTLLTIGLIRRGRRCNEKMRGHNRYILNLVI